MNHFSEFKAMYEQLAVRSVTLQREFVGPLPPRAKAAWLRINANVASPLDSFKVSSDLSYFIGYMEALGDSKGDKNDRKK